MYPIKPVLKIKSVPFFIGPVAPRTNIDVPSTMSFNLGVHPKYAIPVLLVTEEIRALLSKVYSYGSMVSTPLGETELSRDRMHEVLDNLLALFKGNIKGVRFLEIGSGNGTLLNELKVRGADVTGIEIGPQGEKAVKKYALRIIKEPLRPHFFKNKFDCIFSYGCLEHIIELDEFFSASRDCLKGGGLFFHAVPNSEIYFNSGGFGHLAHEHVNYFTKQNAIRLLNSQGFCSARAYTSAAGNELFILGYNNPAAKLAWPGENRRFILEETKKIKAYSRKLNTKIKKVVVALEKMQSKNESIGFYAGGFEYSIFLKNFNKIRYFDSDPYKHGKAWLRGLPCIESPLTLKKQAVDNLLICEDYYYNDIIKYLRKELKISAKIKVNKINSL